MITVCPCWYSAGATDSKSDESTSGSGKFCRYRQGGSGLGRFILREVEKKIILMDMDPAVGSSLDREKIEGE